MKKILFMLISLFIISCTSDNEIIEKNIVTNGPQTEVFVNSNKTDIIETRSLSINYKDKEGYDIPIDGKYEVFYFIRIDNNIPGEYDLNIADEYFPQTSAGKSLLDDLNLGYIKSDVEWKHNFKFTNYIYDKTGGKIQDIIVKEPTLEELVNVDKSKFDLSGYLEHKDELRFIWYACKKQNSDHCWHIDGVLTTKDKKDVTETIYGEEIEGKYTDIEVDIHEQEHKDWEEIKTSVHIRSNTDITITLPIEKENIEPTDDFAIRAFEYKDFEKIDDTNISYQNLKVTVSHEDENTIIKITGVTEEMLKNNNGEITVEVHSYYKTITDEELWERLKNSTVTVTNEKTGIYGQIHYKDDSKDNWIKL